MTLAERLAQQGRLNEADLPRIAEAHAATPETPLHELLIAKGFAKEDDVLAALAEEFGLEVVDLSQTRGRPTRRSEPMPLKLVHRRNLMPISRENGTLVVATGDPYDVYALDELQTVTGLQRPAGAGQPARNQPAHQDPLRRRRRHGRGPGRRARKKRSSSSKTSKPTTPKWPSRPRRRRSSSWSTKS